MNQKGFSTVGVLIIVLILGVGGYLLFSSNKQESNITIEQKNETSDWEVYKNTDYGFEFRYPKEFKLDSHRLPPEYSKPSIIGDRIIRVENDSRPQFFMTILTDSEVREQYPLREGEVTDAGLKYVDTIDLGGYPAAVIEFAGKDGCVTKLLVKRNSLGYLISFVSCEALNSGEESEHDKFIKLLLNTFKFIP
ncbi:MAG: hypothetical protein HYT03_00950 [Candidatus Harrisonbacteria bacterium]|nr:hypothetical protein [Candidatus Harrisonbacteria bacterium]